MASKEDDVRLPFSTLDPLVGDVISLLWEPEILQSMGQTMNLLASEVISLSNSLILDSHSNGTKHSWSLRPSRPYEFYPMAHYVDETVLSYR